MNFIDNIYIYIYKALIFLTYHYIKKINGYITSVQEIFGVGVTQNICRAAGILAEQQDYLRQQAEKAYQRISSTTAFGKIILDIKRGEIYQQLFETISSKTTIFL